MDFASRFIQENEVPERYHDDIRRESAIAALQGRDVDAWLWYWWENNKPHDLPILVFLNPDVMEDLGGDGAGLHYDKYHGFCRDDV